MKIVVLCEGKTEAALAPGLREFLNQRTPPGSNRVRIDPRQMGGHIEQKKKLPKILDLVMRNPDNVGAVVLTDVSPNYTSAADAKEKLGSLIGTAKLGNKVRVHAAKYEVEAWLLPFWKEISKKLGVQMQPPGAKPEDVNNQKPPSAHFEELFGKARRRFQKNLEAPKWLTADNLASAAKSCPELKLFLNSLLELAGAEVRL